MSCSGLLPFLKPDGAVDHRQILGWRDDIDVVGCDQHGFGHLNDRHFRGGL
jgi:hypothetical protein